MGEGRGLAEGADGVSPQTIRLRECARQGCEERFDDFRWSNPWPKAFCSAGCYRRARPPKVERERGPISAASPDQARKRALGASIVSGATRGLASAHLCSRGMGGCDDPLCIVPLTHAEHEAFDRGDLDLLPHLVPRHAGEMAHALIHYRGDLPALLERLTGVAWAPVDRKERAA